MPVELVPYTAQRVDDVLAFERALREQEPDWGWQIDDAYVQAVRSSFADPRFGHSLSLLAYAGGQVVGRIDTTLIASRFDGSVKAYLDWICVLKSHRHGGVGQQLLAEARRQLRAAGATDLVAIIARNAEAQRFYRALTDAVIRDEGIWISL